MDTFVFVLEIIGTIAFTISGAVTAIQKKMDIFGVAILGLTTSVGGGIIRDMILGVNPPATFRNPAYAVCSFLTTFVFLLPFIQNFLLKNKKIYTLLLFWMDTIGLGIFTVVGVRSAYVISETFSIFLLLFVGVVTGCGGGVLRDVMAQNMPYIFVKHIYACASIAGALVTCICWHLTGAFPAMLIGAAVVIVIRALAVHFNWNLPHPKTALDEKEVDDTL